MSRLPRPADVVLAVSFVGFLVAAGCRSRATVQQASPGTTGRVALPAPAAPVAREAVVRAISRAIGATVVIAEVDHHRLAIVADEEESALQLVDLDTRTVASTTKLDGAPGQMLLAPDGTLFVALRGAARLVALRFREGGTAHVVTRHFTADEPFGLALTPDGSTVLVSTIADPGIEAFRAADLAPVFGMPLPRDPRSIAVSSDGARAFVTHATGSIVSVVEVTGESPGTTRTISLDARERRRDFGMFEAMKKPMPMSAPRKSMKGPSDIRISMKRTANQGFGLAMIGERLFLPETLVMTSDNNSIPTGYGSVEQSTLSTHVPFVARVRTKDEKLENPDLSGPADRDCFEQKAECIVPRAVTDDGTKLYVACLDSDEIMVVDPEKDAEHAPACQKTSRERTRVRVESPSGIAIDSERASLVAFSNFSRKLSVASLDRQPPREGETAALVIPRSVALPELVGDGRKLFHRSAEPRLAKNGRACASCHVDGRDDALVWPTPMGKRQTPMLAGRLDGTAPYGWNGEHESLVLHITSTVKNLEGTGLAAQEIEALAAYVASMRPIAKHAATSAAITRGQSIFRSNEAGCSSCHVEETHFTDLETHVFPSQRKQRGPSGFDTPSLAFVGQTAPYFHDGRFTTLEALIDGCEDPGTSMGKTKHLDPDDRRALVAYLRSL